MTDAPPDAPPIPGMTHRAFLGAGGFADVFRYEQQIPRRDVAIKIIRRNAGPAARRRFEAEANLMARLSSHPSILSVYGAGSVEDERHYLMMEYCPPPNLGKRVSAQPLSVARALETGIQIAGAVETIHRAGYLHRDIKPANILLTSFNRPVLTDFGIATPLDEQSTDDEFGGASPPWAPPEQQLDQGPLLPAADVYALAATVFTLLSGRSPHLDPTGAGRNDQLSMLDRALHRPVPAIGRQDVPPQLERVLTTAMAKRPEDRYSTAIAFARALQQIQTDLHMTTTPIDVMEEEPVGTNRSGEGPDATVLRPVTSIDPDGQGATVPGPTRPVPGVRPDATRFVPRRVEAQPASESHTSAPGQRFTVPADQEPGTRAPAGTGEFEHLESTVSRPPAPPPPPAPEPQVPERPRRRGVSAALALVSAALVLCLAGVAVWSILRGEGGTTPTASMTPEQVAVDPPPVVSEVPAIGDLHAVVVDGMVHVSWTYPQDGVTFLFHAVDPVEPRPVQETEATEVAVEPLPGRTCVEVVARTSDGGSSEPATTCVETP